MTDLSISVYNKSSPYTCYEGISEWKYSYTHS